MGARCSSEFGAKSPASYLKVCALLVPREMKVEHSGGVKAMSDEELEAGIEAIQAMLAARDAGANAKVIEAIPALPAPAPTRKRTRKRTVPNGADPVSE